MQRPRYYYMRLSAVCMLIVISAAIISSYLNIPHHSLYQYAANQYWFALGELFLIALAYLLYAFGLERTDYPISLSYHCLAMAIILLVCVKFAGLFHLALVSV